MHTTQFCDSALFRVTVWDIVHEHCSQSKKKKRKEKKRKEKYKNSKNFLVCDLKYGIFILHLQ